jgi:Fe-S-cluster containining protein
MNESKYIEPKKCLTCGKCCKYFSIWYNDDMEDKTLLSEVKRFNWLNTKKIHAKREGKWLKVIFDFPCKYLIEKNGHYACKVYNKDRPELCRKYPYDITKDCPHKIGEE